MELPRDLRAIDVPVIGAVRSAPHLRALWEVTDASGEPVPAASVYLHHIAVDDFEPGTLRSYAYVLLRWFRFLSAIGTTWERATSTDFVDFIGWMQVATPKRGSTSGTKGSGYAARTINLNWSVVTAFYDFHAWAGSGPIVTPVAGPAYRPSLNQVRSRTPTRRAVGRQKVPKRAPRSIPDEVFDRLFLGLGTNRDRALMSLYLATGARASELLNIRGGDINWGENLIRLSRKGSKKEQWVPASPDAMVYLRIYIGTRRIISGDVVWLTLRKPYRDLNYHAVRQVFTRAQDKLGTKYTLHQLRHTAAYRMVQDPNLPITDVQWVLGHEHLDTTMVYLEPHPTDVYKRMLEHFSRARIDPSTAPIARGYDPEVMRGLFGGEL